MEDGGFTLVSRGNNRRGRAKPLDGKAAGRALAAAEGIAESSAADEADIARRIDAAVLELRTSAFWAKLDALVAREAPVESIVCLGVGSYGSSVSARYQLALALLLRETLLGVSAAADAAPPPPTAGGGAALDVYDPVLSEAEVAFARARGCGLPARNEEGRRAVARRTLFFMPHCGRQLYANVVAANWGGEALGRVLILGNSALLKVCDPEVTFPVAAITQAAVALVGPLKAQFTLGPKMPIHLVPVIATTVTTGMALLAM